ncbi:hypothetical protein MRAB57_4655 [Mycobacterium rhizamassiliense]|jgi:hypothetical protein|uniref:Uncharacterized protein n=1 Tax=Mycobacterium rhizamassiliense TaxID=1841860 RepID=A0A2U3NZ84_9MYCO|nr:hypothetical protein MRAB57_4655 [Mycobacterium rhizamassiliense]
MRKATFRMAAAGDGAPPSSAGYWYYLLAHAIGTALLLITLVAAVWQFMDWVVAPSPCLASAAPAPASSSAAPPDQVPVRLAADSRECDCPNSARDLKMPRDSVAPRPAQDVGISGKRSAR